MPEWVVDMVFVRIGYMRALQFSNQDIIACQKSRGIFGTVQPSNETQEVRRHVTEVA